MSWMSSALPSPYQEPKTTLNMTRVGELKDTLSWKPDLPFEHEMETKSRDKGFYAVLGPYFMQIQITYLSSWHGGVFFL